MARQVPLSMLTFSSCREGRIQSFWTVEVCYLGLWREVMGTSFSHCPVISFYVTGFKTHKFSVYKEHRNLWCAFRIGSQNFPQSLERPCHINIWLVVHRPCLLFFSPRLWSHSCQRQSHLGISDDSKVLSIHFQNEDRCKCASKWDFFQQFFKIIFPSLA